MDGIKRMQTNTFTRIAFLGIAVVSLTLTGAVLTNRSDPNGFDSERFWEIPRLRAVEAESFDTLQDMVNSSDVVVVGRVLEVAPSRIIDARPANIADSADPDAWFAGYASVRLDAEWASPAGGAVTFEVFLSTESKYREFLTAPLPKERSLFFLRNKEVAALSAGWPAELAATERPYFMLVNADQGAIHDINGIAQIAEHDGDGLSSRINGVSFEDILREVTQLRE